MRMLIYIVILIVGLLLCLIGTLGILGSLLPRTHSASITFDVAKPRGEVWAMLDRIEDFPAWFPDIQRIELMPERDGHRTFRQFQGRNSFVLEETTKEAPARVVRTIADDHAMFSGSWDHQLEAIDAAKTRITVTETGSVGSPIPRAIMRYFIGHEYYLRKFAKAVKKRCG